MKLKSKPLLHFFALAVFLAVMLGILPRAAHAQQYPSRDIHLVCAFPLAAGPMYSFAISAKSSATSQTGRSSLRTRLGPRAISRPNTSQGQSRMATPSTSMRPVQWRQACIFSRSRPST